MATEHPMKTFDPDDPMLTAYALGELDGGELREIEELIARDPAAARHVESIRAAAEGFGEAFDREPAPRVEPIRPVEIEPKRRSPFIPFLFYASTAAAACFFVVLVLRMSDPRMDVAPADLNAEAPLPAESAAELNDESASNELQRRQSEELRKENDALGQSLEREAASKAMAADMAEPAPARESKDADERLYRAPPAAPPALGEMKARAKTVEGLEQDKKEDAVVLNGFGVVSGRGADTGTLENLERSIVGGKLPERIDTAALLSELGLQARDENEKQILEKLAQTTASASPQPDPEAALVRAVEGFARLVESRAAADDDGWDRVLRDARYAAGDDPKRLEFVGLVEKTRREIGATSR